MASYYNKAFFYSAGEYYTWLLSCVAEQLLLSPDLRLVDIGSGSGSFSAALAEAASLKESVLCVDKSESMLAETADQPRL